MGDRRAPDGAPRQLPLHVLLPELHPASGWCQRWRERRHSFRHRSEGGFDRGRYDVAPLADSVAKAFVERHHYAGSYVASRLRYGMWERCGGLVGVAVLSVPVQRRTRSRSSSAASSSTTACRPNGESWLLGQVFRLAAAEGVRGVVAFSDPVPRRDAAGGIVFPGHVGTIYQAANATYAGRGAPRTLFLLPDGRVLNERALAKLRSLESGHAYVEELLRRFGAPPRGDAEPEAWLARALAAAGVRRLAHPGNHRYLFRLSERVSFGFAGLPFPKRADGAAPAAG